MAAAAALLLLTACSRSGEGDGVRPTPRRAPDPAAYHRPSSSAEIGTGVLVETSRDGSAAYVAQEDARFPQPGCEGQPEPVLFRQPLEGGERELLGDGREPVKGEIIRAPGRRVALVRGCEGFFSGLAVGTETDDGHLKDLAAVEPQRPDDESISPSSFAWSVDGRRLLAAPELAVEGGGKAAVLEVDPATGRTRGLFEVPGASHIAQLGQLANGTYVVAADGHVTLRGKNGGVAGSVGGRAATFAGNGFARAPDGRRIAVFGNELLLVDGESLESTTLVAREQDRQITSAAFSPDGLAVAYVSATSGADNVLAVVTRADGRVTRVAGPGPLGRAVFSGDGRVLAFNEFGGEPLFVAKVLVVRFSR